jgi:hypothetical protein
MVIFIGGTLNRYQCEQCGYIIKNGLEPVIDPEKLYDWLKVNNMLAEED